MHPERGRLWRALLLSLLAHGLLSSLTFDDWGLGMPGFDVPWRDRRIEAPELRVVLVPAPVASTEPKVAPVAAPSRQELIVEPFAGAPAATHAVAPAPTPEAQAQALVGKVETAPQADAALDAAAGSKGAAMSARAVPDSETSAAPARVTQEAAAADDRPRTAGQGDDAPAPVPEQAVMALAPPADETFVVPPTRSVPPPVTGASQGASGPQAVEPAARGSGEEAMAAGKAERERIEREAQERTLELARLERAEQEALRQAAELARQRAVDAAARLKRDEESARQEAARLEASRSDEARLEAARLEAARLEAARLEVARQEAARAEAVRREAAKLEAERVETARAEAVRREASRLEEARLEAARAEAARQEAARLEAARAETARAEVARRAALRLDEARLEAARLEAARQEAASAEAARQEAVRQEAAPVPVAAGQTLPSRAPAAGTRPEAQPAARLPALQTAASSGARRRTLIGRTDRDVVLVMYAEGWRRKIELNTTSETSELVREAKRQPRADPLVTVALRSDGSVEAVTFNRSSGVAKIDEAVRRIVQSLAPYPAFPPDLAREYDVIEIRRVWTFDTAIRLY